MADFPQIQASEPIVVSPVVIPAKTYPDLYMSDLHVNTDVNTPALNTWAVVKLMPYNYANKELMPDGPVQEFTIHDMWAEAARAPLLATVMGGIIQVVSLLVQEKNLVDAIAQGATGLEETLAAVRGALGIT